MLMAIGTEAMRYLWVLSQVDWGSVVLRGGAFTLAVVAAMLVVRGLRRLTRAAVPERDRAARSASRRKRRRRVATRPRLALARPTPRDTLAPDTEAQRSLGSF